jgi:ESS family glutamate:Na+ symporter
MHFNALTTLALAGLVLLLGEWLRRVVPLLARYNVPGPVMGGLIVALATLVARHWRWAEPSFDDSLREPLQNAFFSTIGFGAGFTLLLRGGALVTGLLALTLIGGILQNVVGGTLAVAMGQPALLGVLCGSVTLTGGPSTGLAFAPDFVDAGVAGAAAIALAAAMGGIIAAGVIGAPLGTFLIERTRTTVRGGKSSLPSAAGATDRPDGIATAGPRPPDVFFPPIEALSVMKSLALVVLAIVLGAQISHWLTAHHVKLPSYIGAMIVAVVIRNFDDATGWVGVPQRAIGLVGDVALAYFLALALMVLDLRDLSAVAAPMFAILTVQILLMTVLCAWPVFPLLGRDYDAAVVTSGFFGFMIGTTPVAVANMEALVQRYGPSPRAFLAVPIVGAFLLDFVNALLINSSLSILG